MIVTPVAFVLCQFSVTLCPEVIEAGLTLRATVGEAGVGVGDFASPLAQPIKLANQRDTNPTPMKRKGVLLILLVSGSRTVLAREISDAEPLCSVAAERRVTREVEATQKGSFIFRVFL